MGWKDILRPIRDGLRDNLPSPHRPSDDTEKQKRELQRRRDRLKGFTYFDSFDKIGDWTQEDVDPLQRANTPLLRRATCPPYDDGKADVTLIHDYAGNYHDYEGCQGAEVEAEKHSCEYMQFISTFVYFSHHLISIPPPTWTNTCHRNGVKVLGTFIVEPGTEDVERMFSTTAGGSVYVLAEKLSQMAKSYGFDGWLINIEEIFPVLEWKASHMEGFLRQLRSDLGTEGKVVWYDALTEHNVVQYQNTLSEANLGFALAAGHLLTNYAWTPFGAQYGKTLAIKNGLSHKNLAFGIDVWAQDTKDPGPRRTTWPRNGGGGTGTGLGVAELASMGLSAGVFAPAWPYEHFDRQHKAVERAMWDGAELPNDLLCSCGRDTPHSRVDYCANPITKFAREYPAGSESFFYTDFQKSFAPGIANTANLGKENMRVHLGMRSVLPHLICSKPLPETAGKLELYGQVNDNPPRLTIGIAALLQQTERCARALSNESAAVHTLDLFKLNMAESTDRVLSMTISKQQIPERIFVNVMLEEDPFGIILNLERRPYNRQTIKLRLPASPRIRGLAVTVTAVPSNTARPGVLLEIFDICVSTPHETTPLHSIRNICLVRWDEGSETEHWRLKWECEQSRCDAGPPRVLGPGMPYSEVTGHCSHFAVFVNDAEVGRAYAKEFIVPSQVTQAWKDAGQAEVKVVGIGFNGKVATKDHDALTVVWPAGIQKGSRRAATPIEEGWKFVDRLGDGDSETRVFP